MKIIDKYWDIHQGKFDEQARLYFFMNIWGSLVQMHPHLREQVLSEIEEWSNHDKSIMPDHLPMRRIGLMDMARHPLVSIEAHTNNHAALGYLDYDSQLEEIQSGKLWLEEVLNKPIKGFSYPNGSYNDATISLMKKIGFKYACTTEAYRNSNYISDYKLPRFQVRNWNKSDFINKLEQW